MPLARILATLAVLAVVVSAPRAALAKDDHARFAASFRYTGSSTEQAARRAAIDRGVETFFFVIRGIARARLSEGTKIEPWVAFSFDAGNIRFRTPSCDTVSPATGAPVEYRRGGERTKLSQRVSPGKITQAFVAQEGQRVNEWVLEPQSGKLVLKVTVSSPKLSHPVVYTLTYERVR